MAGVSAGTVDRVLHNRGRVSPEKKARIESILKEIGYEPNIAARFLASKRSYTFAVVIPSHSIGDYWELVCNGIDKAVTELKTFNIHVDYFCFSQYNRESFIQIVHDLEQKEYDGIVVATLFGEHVVKLSKKLEEKGIPYIYIDSGISEQKNMAYFGSDSFVSGTIAAKLMMQKIGKKSNIIIAHIKFKYKDISVQMKTREQGFLHYLNTNGFSGKIHQVEIDPDNSFKGLFQLQNILESVKAPVGGIVLNSRIYELVTLLKKLDQSLSSKMILVGHDAIERNIKALKKGQIAFLLSQRPELQGYDAVKALGNYFLFKQTPPKNNHMPIDILIKENIDYYSNYKL